MDDHTKTELARLVGERIAKQAGQIQHSLQQIGAGNPLGAEPDADRSAAVIANKAKLPLRDAVAMTEMISRTAQLVDRNANLVISPASINVPTVVDAVLGAADVRTTIRSNVKAGAESMHGPSLDLVGVEFLSRGRLAANTVGRVAYRSGRSQGSGFMVGPGLFLTNNHVIPNAEKAAGLIVQFDYEAADDGSDRPVTEFAFDPLTCFLTDPIHGLDFTLIGVGQRISGTKDLDSFGYLPLSDAKDKHMLGEFANIIQHPQGDLKQVVVRGNELISRDETVQVLHYLADTETGSSGSPVCNNKWQPIALHHWGQPSYEVNDILGRPLNKDVNEGIRISAIVRKIRERAAGLTPVVSRRVTDLLALWDSAEAGAWGGAVPSGGNNGDGTVAGAERAREIDFSDRAGYEPGFIPGFIVPLPDYSAVSYKMAVNQQPLEDAEDPHELPYHHFSILMRADRRLASFTACNIDGRRLAAVNRATKTVNTEPTLEDLGAESSDAFRPDPRVMPNEQMTIEFYKDQVVPAYPKPEPLGENPTAAKKARYYQAMSNRTARMFQKGHLTLRGDPAWGTADEALAAERDTFFYTNAAPQIGFFNQGSADDHPASKGKLRWRAIETYVVRNAFTMRRRVSVFAGPIFDDENDPPYRLESRIPMRFWKIAVWADRSTLRSIALIGDQRKVLDRLTEGMPEAYLDEIELARVSEFLTTVASIEELTGLDFGDIVRKADVRAGAESIAAIDVPSEKLFPV